MSLLLTLVKAQGTPDHAGIIFGHAGPFTGPDRTGFVQEGPDIRNFDVFNVNGLEIHIRIIGFF